ncbi:MAG: adenylyl-sulfate kinase [Planctomycetales bacterium]|nr:adenylyl-sulfate kinase [Planctomycetales bacterium]MCA9225683.1 adenylyl-sulfate kinase [Planctomycetales bacterium]
MSERTHVVWHEHNVTRADRERLCGHRGCVVWFTGLSGCGKSTVANLVDRRLHESGVHTFLLDGDNVRMGLNASPELLAEHGSAFAQRFGLGFGAEDREENIRRIGAVAELFASAGLVTLTAFVSPYRRDRDAVRRRLEAGRAGDFVEVLVNAPLEVCEARDPKGLYKLARAGKIRQFTGIDDPYEPPENPELTLDSAAHTPDVLADQVVQFLAARQLIPAVE